MLEPELQLRIYVKATFWDAVLVIVLLLTRFLRHLHEWADNLCYEVAVHIYGEPEDTIVYRICTNPGCKEVTPEYECVSDMKDPYTYLCPICEHDTEVCTCDD